MRCRVTLGMSTTHTESVFDYIPSMAQVVWHAFCCSKATQPKWFSDHPAFSYYRMA